MNHKKRGDQQSIVHTDRSTENVVNHCHQHTERVVQHQQRSLEDDTISSQKGRRPRRRLMAKLRLAKEPRRTSPIRKMRHVVLGESLDRTAGCFDEAEAEPMARSSAQRGPRARRLRGHFRRGRLWAATLLVGQHFYWVESCVFEKGVLQCTPQMKTTGWSRRSWWSNEVRILLRGEIRERILNPTRYPLLAPSFYFVQKNRLPTLPDSAHCWMDWAPVLSCHFGSMSLFDERSECFISKGTRS